MYTLYTIPGYCSTAITVLMNKLNLEVNLVHRDSIENYLDLNPTNQVPTLVAGDNVLTENGAIAICLLEKYAPQSIPSEFSKRLDFYKWLLFMYSTLHPAYAKIFLLKQEIDESSNDKYKLMQKAADNVSNLLIIIENKLKKDGTLVNENFSIIDYALKVFVDWNNLLPQLNIDVGPLTRNHLEKVSKLPEYISALEAEELVSVKP